MVNEGISNDESAKGGWAKLNIGVYSSNNAVSHIVFLWQNPFFFLTRAFVSTPDRYAL